MLRTPQMFFSAKGKDLYLSSHLEDHFAQLRTLADCAEEKQVTTFLDLCKLVYTIREHGILALQISPDVIFQDSEGDVAIEFKGLDNFPDASCLTWVVPWGFPYTPPEVWDPGIGMHWPQKVTDEKAAVWALGATMYEISSPFCQGLEEYIRAMEHGCAVMIRLEISDALRRIIQDALTLFESNRPSLIDLIKNLKTAEKSFKNSRLKEKEEVDGMSRVSTDEVKDKYPLESRVKVPRSDGSISDGIVLEHQSKEKLVVVGFGTGDRGFKMKFVRSEDLDRLNPEGPRLSQSGEQITLLREIGTEIFIRRTNGAVEKGVVVACSPTGKYIKVVSKAKTWKWFPREVLEELQKKA